MRWKSSTTRAGWLTMTRSQNSGRYWGIVSNSFVCKISVGRSTKHLRVSIVTVQSLFWSEPHNSGQRWRKLSTDLGHIKGLRPGRSSRHTDLPSPPPHDLHYPHRYHDSQNSSKLYTQSCRHADTQTCRQSRKNEKGHWQSPSSEVKNQNQNMQANKIQNNKKTEAQEICHWEMVRTKD